ncbi:hypothetical protein ACB092_10G204500 [Castanea dentata]
MDDINKEDDSLAIELYRNTMTGQWKKVVEMYKEHKIKAMSAKINTSGDTALHVAVSIAPDKEAQQLVRVIKDCYDEEVKKIKDCYDEEVKKINDRFDLEVAKIKDKAEYEDSLKNLQKKQNDDINVCDEKVEEESSDILESAVWIKNNEGNTPLHVAATAQRMSICILLIRSFDSFQSVLGMHNIRGESPLFLAAFHGHKKIFIYFYVNILLGNSKFSNTDPESINPAYLRTDGETILHCAIRWEYFDLAFEILDREPMLAYFVNEQGITPLHLLASKPAVFRSGFHLGQWKKIKYHCNVLTFVDAIDLLMAGKGETSKLVNTDTETPVLLAARNGITEMVEQILAVFPLAINYRSKGKNIVLWAVKNRQPRVLQLLLKRDFVKRKLIHEVDTEKNNALHLAADIGEKKPWRIPGAALQMQWEIKWYQFVKDNMPQHFCYQLNEKDKTP